MAAAGLTAGGLALGLGCLGLREHLNNGSGHSLKVAQCLGWLGSGSALSADKVQKSVVSGTKQHALYLTIKLNRHADGQKCARILATQLQMLVDEVVPADLSDEEDEILAGMGFSNEFLSDTGLKAPTSFAYASRYGDHGAMPSTGGDIFIHAKCNNQGSLFELTQKLIRALPAGAIAHFEDIYGFVYRNGRDLSGFIDGTENMAAEEDRLTAGVNPQTGGSFVIAQKWIHRHDVIENEKDKTLEQWIGRTRADSVELPPRAPPTSHVERITDDRPDRDPASKGIVRQSQPWGDLHSGQSGLFFIAYANQVSKFDGQLDRMTQAGHSDKVMRLTRCVQSQYYYFPSLADLRRI